MWSLGTQSHKAAVCVCVCICVSESVCVCLEVLNRGQDWIESFKYYFNKVSFIYFIYLLLNLYINISFISGVTSLDFSR